MYTTIVENVGATGNHNSLVGAVKSIVGVKDAVVSRGRRAIAFWCSHDSVVKFTASASDAERTTPVRFFA